MQRAIKVEKDPVLPSTRVTHGEGCWWGWADVVVFFGYRHQERAEQYAGFLRQLQVEGDPDAVLEQSLQTAVIAAGADQRLKDFVTLTWEDGDCEPRHVFQR